MAQATYEFVAVPLGLPIRRTQFAEFSVHLISHLTVDASCSEIDLCDFVDENPLWASDDPEVHATVTLLDPSRPTISVRLRRVATSVSATGIRERLKEYLLGKPAMQATHAKRGVYAARSDTRFDRLSPTGFFDSQKMYDDSIPERDFVAYAMNLGFASALPESVIGEAFDLSKLNTRLLRATNSLVMQKSIGEMFGPSGALTNQPSLQELLNRQWGALGSLQLLGGAAGSFRADLSRLGDRIHGFESGAQPAMLREDPAVPEEDLGPLVEQREPNTLLRAATKDPLLSRVLGLVSEWRVALEIPASIAAVRGEILIDLARPPASLVFRTKPTVFRIDGDVAPAPKNPGLAPIGGMAWLNKRANGNDYRALQVDANGELIKAWVAQSSNSLKTKSNTRRVNAGIAEPEDPAKRIGDGEHTAMPTDPRTISDSARIADDPPDVLRGQAAGINQAETKGVTFSASVEDLANAADPRYGVDAREAEGKYYLEDLWVGYRIDVAIVGEGIGPQTFRSLNYENVDCEITGTRLRFNENQESYFEREQLCIDRPTGTEITTWTGIAESQQFPFRDQLQNQLPSETATGSLDYETPQDLTPSSVPFVRIVKPVPGSLPRLLYGRRYAYRIRNVFCGATSLSPSEANDLLENKSALDLRARHIQEFEFLRAEAFSPGEVANPRTFAHGREENEQVVYLLEPGDDRQLYLLPRPLSMTEMRFGGYIGRSADETERYRAFAETRNVRRLMIDGSGKLTRAKYFLDGEVSSVILRADVVTRNPDVPPGDQLIGGVDCETVRPWRALTARLDYGEPDEWETYRPIELQFTASDGVLVQGRIVHRSRRSGRLVLSVPPGDVVEISLLPAITAKHLRRSFFYGNAKNWAARAGASFFPRMFGELPPLPTLPIVVERKIRVIHATRKPLRAPTLAFDDRYLRRQADGGIMTDAVVFQLPRATDNHVAYVVGAVSVHAPTTAEIFFNIRWKEIHDLLDRPRHSIVTGSAQSEPRSILFAERDAPDADEVVKFTMGPGARAENVARLANRLEEQCLENNVHLSIPQSGGSGAGQVCNAIDFKSPARRIAEIVVRAKARYRHLYASTTPQEHELESNIITVDAPSQLVPPLVQVSHVLPTFSSDMSDITRGSVAGKAGLRVYVDRPWFLTGVGERCAVGCLFRYADTVEQYAVAKRYSTLWGEDVFERPGFAETRRVPRAEDFTTNLNDSGDDIDLELYPPFDRSERSPLFHVDNVPLDIDLERQTAGSGTNPDRERLVGVSLASYALRYDANQQLYYFDMQVKGGFFGWLKLALYRHQPSAATGCEISREPTFVYAAILQDEVVLQHYDEQWLMVRVGPVFDTTVTFVAAETVELAEGIVQARGPTHLLQEHHVDGLRYLVVRVPRRLQGHLTLYKLRAGVRQCAFPL